MDRDKPFLPKHGLRVGVLVLGPSVTGAAIENAAFDARVRDFKTVLYYNRLEWYAP